VVEGLDRVGVLGSDTTDACEGGGVGRCCLRNWSSEQLDCLTFEIGEDFS
jgi:hypothetical protein